MIGYTVGTVESHPIIAVDCRSSTAQNEISKTIRKAFMILTAYMQETGTMPMGPAVTLYHSIDQEQAHFSLGYPVSDGDLKKVKDGIKVVYIPGGKVAKAVHQGPYSSMFKTYVQIYERMQEAGLEHGGAAWEVYLNSSGQTPKEDMLTEIYISVH